LTAALATNGKKENTKNRENSLMLELLLVD